MERQQQGPPFHPGLLVVGVTLVVTGLASCMLTVAVMTRHWESLTWHSPTLQTIAANSTNREVVLDWLLDDAVVRISVRHPKKSHKIIASVFLIPMHGGIWTLCVDLTQEQTRILKAEGFPDLPCTNYLASNVPVRTTDEPRTDWQTRMQNLSISCALVCLIILGSSALVGAFGVLKHQISAVLVTGVMYLLAATFALFTLTIIHFKRARSAECRNDGEVGRLADGVVAGDGQWAVLTHLKVWQHYYPARVFSTGWSLDLGWAATLASALASALWILLAKVMRYSPLPNALT